VGIERGELLPKVLEILEIELGLVYGVSNKGRHHTSVHLTGIFCGVLQQENNEGPRTLRVRLAGLLPQLREPFLTKPCQRVSGGELQKPAPPRLHPALCQPCPRWGPSGHGSCKAREEGAWRFCGREKKVVGGDGRRRKQVRGVGRHCCGGRWRQRRRRRRSRPRHRPGGRWRTPS
jgi:hypothetical protein